MKNTTMKKKHDHDKKHDHEKKKKDDKQELLEVVTDIHEYVEDHHKKKKKQDHDHHDHGKEEKKHKRKDFNIHAVFLHYLGDALSSILVLIAGLLAHFFVDKDWTAYLDPVSSLFIVALILFTTLPLLRDCSVILLQKVPSIIKIPYLKEELKKVEGVQGIHELHVWQLVDNIIIATLHVSVFDTDSSNFKSISKKVKQVMHKFGIHSTTLQPEFILKDSPVEYCDQNCVKDCPEDWCCKEEVKTVVVDNVSAYSTFSKDKL